MRPTDWPERMARFLRTRGECTPAEFVAAWVFECTGQAIDGSTRASLGASLGPEIPRTFAQRGDIAWADEPVICAGKNAIRASGSMVSMSQAVCAWRVA